MTQNEGRPLRRLLPQCREHRDSLVSVGVLCGIPTDAGCTGDPLADPNPRMP
jgi:hypothetical protein